MNRMDSLELVSAHPWEKAVFTTYVLSLSFFEAVVLDALVRGGGREPGRGCKSRRAIWRLPDEMPVMGAPRSPNGAPHYVA